MKPDILLKAIFGNERRRAPACPHSCDCNCYKDGSVHINIMACCVRCDLCGGNIREGLMKIHRTDCHKIGPRMETL